MTRRARRPVVLALVLVFLVTVAGCARGGAKVPTLVPGVLRVGSSLDYEPFEYYQARPGRAPSLKGFDVELVQAIAGQLDLRVRWVDTGFSTIFASLASNNLDVVAAAATITPARQRTVNFSNPYFQVNQSLTVNLTRTPAITSIDKLGRGNVIAVQSGSTGASWANENLLSKGVRLKSFNLSNEMFAELEAGTVAGVINDEPASRAEVAGLPGLKVVQVIDTGEHYGLAVSKGNPGLLSAVNNALDRIIADGTYARLFRKYFPGLEVPPQFQQ